LKLNDELLEQIARATLEMIERQKVHTKDEKMTKKVKKHLNKLEK
jgi:hypothetical protein